jgi:plasmid stability protein
MKSVYIDEDVHRRLKLRAAERGVPLQRLVEEYVRAGLGSSVHGTTDPSTAEITAAAAGGGAFDFWADEGEDLYLPSDGKSLG